MNSAPLDQVRFGWRDHKLALWYIGFSYRRPSNCIVAVKPGSRTRVLGNCLFLYLHALPYMIVLSVLGRMALTRSLPSPSFATIIAGTLGVGIIFFGFILVITDDMSSELVILPPLAVMVCGITVGVGRQRTCRTRLEKSSLRESFLGSLWESV